MNNLNAKAKAVSVLLFAIMSMIAVAIPLSHITQMLIALSAVLSAISHFLGVVKNTKWSMFAWIWSAFCLPYFLAQILLFDYLTQYITVESLITWGLPVYFIVLPFVLTIMFMHLKLVAAEMH